MKLRAVFLLILVCLAVVLFSCRRNQPSLIDANRPPDTELWYAPADSSEYGWNAHLYWRGVDSDGIVVGYIWTVTDSLEPDPERMWNPAEHVADFQSGHMTARTDTVIPFVAFTNVAGVGLKKNRQAFHVAAIDDNGRIDPEPAVVQFVAIVGELPKVQFTTYITKIEHGDTTTVPKLYDPATLDTVGMFRPFSISYRGSTTNGSLLGYTYFPLTAGVTVVGQDVWSEDLSDTIRYFKNSAPDTTEPDLVEPDSLPSGIFRFAAQCRDESGAESRADVSGFTEGVVQIVVNFEPDTEIFQVENTYFIAGEEFTEVIDFKDGIPDTVPYKSWVRIDYRGWDDPGDGWVCEDDTNKCIRYQIQYERDSDRVAGGNSRSRWLPDEPADDNDQGTADSTSINIGSVEYKIRARAVDEQGKPDGTMFDPDGVPKSQVEIIGNYDPTLDEAFIRNYDTTVIPADGDTIVWNWWEPANNDTLGTNAEGDSVVIKTFYFDVNAAGHDHPKESSEFGIKDWFYLFTRTNDGRDQKFARSRAWVAGPTPNLLADRHERTYTYVLDRENDPGGRSIFEKPPSDWNREYNFSIFGRDIGKNEPFEENIFIGGEKVTLNSYQASVVGRWTETREFRFFLKVER